MSFNYASAGLKIAFENLSRQFVLGVSRAVEDYLRADGGKLPLTSRMVTEDLTRRETQVLELAIQDLSNQEIADKLNVSIQTVKFHLQNIYRKKHVNTKNSLVRLLMGQDVK
jgi:DNA-binding CsgD family transcriptional regulator